MSATSNILSFTDELGVVRKPSVSRVDKIINTSPPIVILLDPVRKYVSADSYATLKTEAGVLFEATENGVLTLFNSFEVERIAESDKGGTYIYYRSERMYLVSEDISTIEEKIDNADTTTLNVEEFSQSGTVADNTDVVYITTSGITLTLLASPSKLAIDIINVSGGSSTINAGGNTIMGESDATIPSNASYTMNYFETNTDWRI
jgi:hypothetical protein